MQYPGALVHVTARGNEKRPTFLDDRDRRRFLELLAESIRRFEWIVTAYVLMSNHFHVLLQLTEVSLSDGMKWLNGKYAQWFNAAHSRVGHLFQGRFESPLVEKQTYFEEVLRYIVLNPVRAKMVGHPEDYEWSSYRATAGLCDAPDWLAVDNALASFGDDRGVARARYKAFVEASIGSKENPWNNAAGQIYLGSAEFIEAMRDRIEVRPRSHDHPLAQRELRPAMHEVISAVAQVMSLPEDRIRTAGSGMARSLVAWIGRYEANLTNRQIAAALRLRSEGHVSNVVAQCDRELSENAMLREAVDRCMSTLGRKNQRPKT
jgi:putative transposase